MASLRLIVIFLLAFLVSCSSLGERKEVTLENLPDSEHKRKSIELSQRNPINDAREFYQAGGVGFITYSYSGIAVIVSGENSEIWKRQDNDERYMNHFDQLVKYRPKLHKTISNLLEDPNREPDFVGNRKLSYPIMLKNPFPPKRMIYKEIRTEYSASFNEEMSRLVN